MRENSSLHAGLGLGLICIATTVASALGQDRSACLSARAKLESISPGVHKATLLSVLGPPKRIRLIGDLTLYSYSFDPCSVEVRVDRNQLVVDSRILDHTFDKPLPRMAPGTPLSRTPDNRSAGDPEADCAQSLERIKSLNQVIDELQKKLALIENSGRTDNIPSKSRFTQMPVQPKRTRGPEYGGDGTGHWIRDVSSNGRIVTLEDESVWEIETLSRIETALWLPVSEIVIRPARDYVGDYRYVLINKDEGETALAKYLGP